MPKPIRRVVTGHDAAGRSVFVMDGPAPHVYCRSPGSAVVTELWETRATPADNRGNAEVTDHAFRLAPPKNGSVFRIIEYPPDSQRLAALASEASGQRGNSIVRAPDTRPEPGSSARERYVEAPLVATDVDLVVSGPTARARVTQIFHNPTDGWVEAVYVYPLPEGGAVDTLKMVVGDRVIVGDVKDRASARDAYEQAKSAGQKASLIEQERPNIFTNSVANIGPHETVVVQIEYQEPVRQSGNEFSLRVPLVVAPRYIPAPIVQTVDFGGAQGWGRVADDPVPDRDRITPPVLDPRQNAPVNPVAITIRLQPGFPL